MSRPVYLRAPAALAHVCAAYDHAARGAFDRALASRIQDLCGRSLRQASRFIHLAAAGALAVVSEAAPPSSTGVYLATGLGDQGTPSRVFAQTRDGQNAVSPFDFVNMNSNTAAYYIARLASLGGPNLTISQGALSFEWALRQAWIAIQDGLDHALVGGVDEGAPSRVELGRRYKLRRGRAPGEGSAWLLLSTEPAHAAGRLIDMRWFTAPRKPDRQRLYAPLMTHAGRPPDFLSFGPGVSPRLVTELAEIVPHATVQTPLSVCGDYPTASAFAITENLRPPSPSPATFLHVASDGRGHLAAILYRSGTA